MPCSLIDSVAELASESTRYVFREMLGLSIVSDVPSPLPLEPGGQIVGSVGFVGQANGLIHFYMGARFARAISARMLDSAESENDDDERMVNEAIGELANVVVGRVKSRLCDGGRSCAITVPSILRGPQLTVGEISDINYRLLGFGSGEHRLLVELVVREA